MRPHVRVIAAVAGTVIAAAAATACSGSSSPNSSADSTASPSASVALQEAAKATATVTTKSVSLGKILVNDKNMTLYLFQADKTSTSTCTGACAAAWPPLTVSSSGKPTAAGGVQSKLLSTSKRSGGGMQVTYNGHPLYRFAGDSKPGDVNGQGLNNFGAKWYVLGTDGKAITKSGGSSTGGNGGY
ncbi:hypothetical protein OG900_22220 [Streptomyces sp. NBC_00433]